MNLLLSLILSLALIPGFCSDPVILQPDDNFGFFSLDGKPIEYLVLNDIVVQQGEDIPGDNYQVFWAGNRLLVIFDPPPQDIQSSWICRGISPDSIYLPFIGD